MNTWLMRRLLRSVPVDDLVHEFVGVQAALHQQAGLAGAHQRHGGLGGRVAVRRVDDARVAQVQAELRGGVADLAFRSDQDGVQQARSRASSAADSDGSSQGWAMAQGAADSVWARAMSLS